MEAAMNPISSVSTSNVFGLSGISNANANANKSTQTPTDTTSVASTITSFGGSSATSLTYNAAGLMGASQQAAQNALRAVENVVTQTQGSLGVSASSSASALDMFGSAASTQPTTDSNMNSGVNSTVSSGQKSAQEALTATQNSLTQTLGALI